MDELASDYAAWLSDQLDHLGEMLIAACDPVVRAERLRIEAEYQAAQKAQREAARRAERERQAQATEEERQRAIEERELALLKRDLARLRAQVKTTLTTKRAVFKDSPQYKALSPLRRRIRLYESLLENGFDGTIEIELPEELRDSVLTGGGRLAGVRQPGSISRRTGNSENEKRRQ